MNSLLYIVILMLFWLVWSGLFDGFHISLGIISVAIVYYATKSSMVSDKPSSKWIKQFIAFEKYSFWLTKEIILANIQVLKLAFKPCVKSAIQPQMITFKTPIKSEMGQFILAQSITLTPGTVTVRIKDNEFMVHAITQEAADALPGEMQEKVNQIFNEETA